MSFQRHVWPLQCTPEPPTTSPGRNDPSRRIGNASCEGLLRTAGTEKSASVLRWPPRSRATTFKPAALSSLASMPPVQPSPTMTTSTSFSLVVMSSSLSAHVRDADGVDRVFLVAVLLDVLVVDRD